MSIYENDASKIYPALNPTTSLQQEANPQNYRLAKIREVELWFLHKITEREKSAKKMQLLDTILNAVGSGLITRGYYN